MAGVEGRSAPPHAVVDRLRRTAAGRSVLGLGRSARRVSGPLRHLGAELRRSAGLAALPARAVAHRGARSEHAAALAAAVAGLPPVELPPVDAPPITVLLVAPAGAVPPSARAGLRTVTFDDATADLVAEWRRAVADAREDVVVLVSARVAPVEPGWLARLVGVLGATTDDRSTVAAIPRSVHPDRRRWRATVADGTTRELGIEIQIDGSGAPTAKALGAGAPVAPGHPVHEVMAGSGAAIALRRNALEAAGGLVPSSSAAAAIVDLCLRLGQAGGSVVAVPDSLVYDDRPFATAGDLGGVPVGLGPTTPSWHQIVAAHGASIRRIGLAAAGLPAPLRIACTVAAPNARVAPRWGDTHLAADLAAALRSLGHDVTIGPLDHADTLAVRAADVHVVLRGVAPVERTRGQRHVLWVISHPDLITDEECDAADLVLVASERFAVELADRTSTPVEVLLQATDPARFRPEAADSASVHPVTVVAKTRDVLRPIVRDALAAGVRPAIYGSGWEQFGLGDLVIRDHLANEDLPGVYASAGVVLNDHWADMAAHGFVSNRIFDVLACGTPIISDPLPELDDLFDGAVLTYQSPAELAALVSSVAAAPDAARARAARGGARVRELHTFARRARQLVDALEHHSMLPD